MVKIGRRVIEGSFLWPLKDDFALKIHAVHVALM
jgi:hypothetical protein